MRLTAILLTLGMITFSVASAQTSQKQLPGKPSEQTEIKGDKQIEKQLQKKQLSQRPELLNEEILTKAEVNKNSVPKTRKNKKGSYIKPKKS